MFENQNKFSNLFPTGNITPFDELFKDIYEYPVSPTSTAIDPGSILSIDTRPRRKSSPVSLFQNEINSVFNMERTASLSPLSKNTSTAQTTSDSRNQMTQTYPKQKPKQPKKQLFELTKQIKKEPKRIHQTQAKEEKPIPKRRPAATATAPRKQAKTSTRITSRITTRITTRPRATKTTTRPRATKTQTNTTSA